MRALTAWALVVLSGLLAGCGTLTIDDRPLDRAAAAIALVPVDDTVRQQSATACGAAALAGVLNYWQRPASETTVALTTQRNARRGITAGDLRDHAAAHGLEAWLVSGDLELLRRHTARGRPVMTLMPGTGGRRHFVTVTGVDVAANEVVFVDPARGLRAADAASFVGAWRECAAAALLVARHAPATGSGSAGDTPFSGDELVELSARSHPGIAGLRGSSGGIFAFFIEVLAAVVEEHPLLFLLILLGIIIAASLATAA